MLPHTLCVAPMMDRTDRHCRYLLRLVSPRAWLYTEMITAAALVRGGRSGLLCFDASEHPVALQLGGSEPGELARAAELGAAAGFDEINLNIGCPSSRVQSGCFGAALMLEPERVAAAVGAIRAAVDVPVTIKTRLGVDEHDSYEFLHELVAATAAAGCGTFFVHARKAWLAGLSPKQNRDVPPLDYARVHRLKREHPELEIVINGGLDTAAAAAAELEAVDGVMLGRAAYKAPLLLAELEARLFARAGAPSRYAIARAFLEHVETELDAGTPLKVMTRHLIGLQAGMRGSRAWRRSLSELPDGARGLECLRELVEQLDTQPAISDCEYPRAPVAATIAAVRA